MVKSLYTVFPPIGPSQLLFNFKAFRSGAFWRAGFTKEWEVLISKYKLCHFSFPINSKNYDYES